MNPCWVELLTHSSDTGVRVGEFVAIDTEYHTVTRSDRQPSRRRDSSRLRGLRQHINIDSQSQHIGRGSVDVSLN